MKHFVIGILVFGVNLAIGQADLCGTKMKKNLLKGVDISMGDSSSYEVPVIFHVLYNNKTENVHDSLILKALKLLKNDFAGLNADLDSVPEEFQDDIGNPQIQFVLAEVLPNGDSTTGIIRKFTKKKRFNHRRRKSFDLSKIIAPETYLNVYICDLSRPGSTPSNPALYTNNRNNGIRVDYLRIVNGTRTITHEVGHWLSLLHTFEGGCSNKDQVDDTPAQTKIWNCPEVGTEHCEGPIMFSNFMGYCNCRYFFTKGQVVRMHAYINEYKSFKKTE